jgi:hypothetical protein
MPLYGVTSCNPQPDFPSVGCGRTSQSANSRFSGTCRWPRFSKNWFKLRIIGLTEFDALVVLDSDMIVRQSRLSYHHMLLSKLLTSSKGRLFIAVLVLRPAPGLLRKGDLHLKMEFLIKFVTFYIPSLKFCP